MKATVIILVEDCGTIERIEKKVEVELEHDMLSTRDVFKTRLEELGVWSKTQIDLICDTV